MKVILLVISLLIVEGPASAAGNAIVGSDEVLTVWLDEAEGKRKYSIPHHDLSPKFASGNYYCKKLENNKWIRCSRRTGQNFGTLFDHKLQCEKNLP